VETLAALGRLLSSLLLLIAFFAITATLSIFNLSGFLPASMAVKCRKCNKCIGKNDEYLSCRRESCNGSYHITCVGVTKSMLATMKKSGDVKTWSCGFCTPVSEHDGDDDGDKRASILPPLLIDVNLNNLPDRLKDVLSDFSKQISVNFALLCNQISNLQHENQLLRTEIGNLIKKIPENVSAHVPLRQQPPSSTYAQTLKTIVVKPKNTAQSAAKTKTDILTNLNPIIDSELDVVKVKSIKDGGVLLKCSDPKEEFKKLVSKENMKENYDIHDVKVIQPRLRISGISRDIQEDHIPSLLVKQNKHIFSTTSHCKLIKYSPIKKRNDVYQIVLEVDILTYNMALKSGHCMIGLDGCTSFELQDATDVMGITIR
jgi:hypothetical protein